MFYNIVVSIIKRGACEVYRGRPRKLRRVGFAPRASFFKPQGVPLRALDFVTLCADEAEVIRLIDFEGLNQDETASKIGVSRITVQRIYKSARRKISDALINAKALKIESNSDFVNYCRCPVGRRCGCNTNFMRGGE